MFFLGLFSGLLFISRPSPRDTFAFLATWLVVTGAIPFLTDLRALPITVVIVIEFGISVALYSIIRPQALVPYIDEELVLMNTVNFWVSVCPFFITFISILFIGSAYSYVLAVLFLYAALQTLLVVRDSFQDNELSHRDRKNRINWYLVTSFVLGCMDFIPVFIAYLNSQGILSNYWSPIALPMGITPQALFRYGLMAYLPITAAVLLKLEATDRDEVAHRFSPVQMTRNRAVFIVLSILFGYSILHAAFGVGHSTSTFILFLSYVFASRLRDIFFNLRSA